MTYSCQRYFKLIFELLILVLTPSVTHPTAIGENDLILMGLRMTLKTASAETVARLWRTPSADTWSRRLRRRTPAYHADRINYTLRRVIRRAGLRPDQDLPLAVDITARPYYGKKRTSYILGGRRKSGTNWYFKYLVVSVVLNHYRFPIYVRPLTRSAHKHLDRVLAQALEVCRSLVGIRLLLLDRGFYQARMVQYLETQAFPYAICAVKNKRFRRLAPLVNPQTWQPVVLRRPDGAVDRRSPTVCFLEPFQFGKIRALSRLLLIQVTHTFQQGRRVGQQEARTLGFLTNFQGPPTLIPALYRKRWGIETTFRELWRVLPPCGSSHPSIRCFNLGLALIIYSVWVLANAELTDGLRPPEAELAILLLNPDQDAQEYVVPAFDFKEDGLAWLNKKQRRRPRAKPPPRRS